MKTIVIKTFSSLIDAELVQNYLRENGVESYLQQRIAQTVHPFGVTGINLMIKEEDKDKALELLKEVK